MILNPKTPPQPGSAPEDNVLMPVPWTPMLRDWSLITGRGATKWENRGSETFCAPPPSRQGKTFHIPPLKAWKLFAPYNMANTSRYHVKTTVESRL